MQRIIAAVDRSESSMRAADFAADLAARYRADLVLLIVGRDISAPDPGMEAFARMEHLQEPLPALELETLRDRLAPVRDQAVRKGVPNVLVQALAGDPAHEILGFARDEKADVIVLGSRGHGRLAGLLLGSVTQKVVALAHCPVLVVP